MLFLIYCLQVIIPADYRPTDTITIAKGTPIFLRPLVKRQGDYLKKDQVHSPGDAFLDSNNTIQLDDQNNPLIVNVSKTDGKSEESRFVAMIGGTDTKNNQRYYARGVYPLGPAYRDNVGDHEEVYNSEVDSAGVQLEDVHRRTHQRVKATSNANRTRVRGGDAFQITGDRREYHCGFVAFASEHVVIPPSAWPKDPQLVNDQESGPGIMQYRCATSAIPLALCVENMTDVLVTCRDSNTAAGTGIVAGISETYGPPVRGKMTDDLSLWLQQVVVRRRTRIASYVSVQALSLPCTYMLADGRHTDFQESALFFGMRAGVLLTPPMYTGSGIKVLSTRVALSALPLSEIIRQHGTIR